MRSDLAASRAHTGTSHPSSITMRVCKPTSDFEVGCPRTPARATARRTCPLACIEWSDPERCFAVAVVQRQLSFDDLRERSQ